MRTQTGTGSPAFCQPMGDGDEYPHVAGNSTKLVRLMTTEMKGKHTGRTINGWLGYETNFLPRVWLERGMAQFSFSVLFFTATLTELLAAEPRSANGTVRGTAANSSSALQPSLYLRSEQVEPDCVPEPLRAQHTSKMRKIILSTVNVHTAKNFETQTKPLAGLWLLPLYKAEAVLLLSLDLSELSVALTLFLTNGADKSPLPQKPPEIPSFAFQTFKKTKNKQTETTRGPH